MTRVDEETVRVLLAVGAAAVLLGSLLQAIAELSEYKDLVSDPKLPEDVLRELVDQYTTVRYWVRFLLWSFVPIYGFWRNLYIEPGKLIQKVIMSKLDDVQTARANTALIKARNWAIIVFGGSLALVASIADAVNA